MDIPAHRYPFLLVDRVIRAGAGQTRVRLKTLRANEPQFTGHWPGKPGDAGVLIIEAMAQVGGILLLDCRGENKSLLAMFAALWTACASAARYCRANQLRIEARAAAGQGTDRQGTPSHRRRRGGRRGELMFALTDDPEARQDGPGGPR